MRADRIAVVHDGGSSSSAPTKQLVAQGGRYAAMVATWDHHHVRARLLCAPGTALRC